MSNRLSLVEEDKLYIMNNFRNMSASKIAKDLSRTEHYSKVITGPMIYSIVNVMRIDIHNEITKLKKQNQLDKALKLEQMLKVLLPNKKQRVYPKIETVVDKIFFK